MPTYPPHPTLGTPEHIAALAEIDAETEAFRARHCIRGISAEQARRLNQLSDDMEAVNWRAHSMKEVERLLVERRRAREQGEAAASMATLHPVFEGIFRSVGVSFASPTPQDERA